MGRMAFKPHLLGFQSAMDFMNSVFGIKTLLFNGAVAGLFAFLGYLTGWVYDSPSAVLSICVLYFLDMITGIYKSYCVRSRGMVKKPFLSRLWASVQSNKLIRGFISLFVVLVLLGVAHNFAKSESVFVFLPGIVIGGVFATQFVSVIENMEESGLIKSNLAGWIKDKIKINKLFKQKKEDERKSTN